MEEQHDYVVIETQGEPTKDSSVDFFNKQLVKSDNGSKEDEAAIEDTVDSDLSKESETAVETASDEENDTSKNAENSEVTTEVSTDKKVTIIVKTGKTAKEPKKQATQRKQSAPRASTADAKPKTSEETKMLMAELKAEQKARADAEQALEKMRLAHERTLIAAQKTAQTEVAQAKNYADKAVKAAQAETAKVKVEAERDRAKAKKLYDTVIDKAKKDLANAVMRQKRAEKTAIERSSQAAERSRQVASLRMELSRERMKSAHVVDSADSGLVFHKQNQNGQQGAPQQGAQPNAQPTNTNGQFMPFNSLVGVGQPLNNLVGIGQPLGVGLDPTITQIQHMLAELVIRMRATPSQPPQYQQGLSPDVLALLLRQQPSQPVMPVPMQPAYATSGLTPEALKLQQDAMDAQLLEMQSKQQAKFEELMRQQQDATEKMTRKHQEVSAELEHKQRVLDEELARKKKAAEENLAKKQQQDEEDWKKQVASNAAAHNPTVDEVADSLNEEIESRGGVSRSVTLSISDFLKKRDGGDSTRSVPDAERKYESTAVKTVHGNEEKNETTAKVIFKDEEKLETTKATPNIDDKQLADKVLEQIRQNLDQVRRPEKAGAWDSQLQEEVIKRNEEVKPQDYEHFAQPRHEEHVVQPKFADPIIQPQQNEIVARAKFDEPATQPRRDEPAENIASIEKTSDDPLDDLIVSLSRELADLKSALDGGKPPKKKN